MNYVIEEVTRKDLRVGDRLLTKAHTQYVLTIKTLAPGVGGKHTPYLVMEQDDGNSVEHDTSFDGKAATYSRITGETNGEKAKEKTVKCEAVPEIVA